MRSKDQIPEGQAQCPSRHHHDFPDESETLPSVDIIDMDLNDWVDPNAFTDETSADRLPIILGNPNLD